MNRFTKWLTLFLLGNGLLFGYGLAHAKTLIMAANYDSQPFFYVAEGGEIKGFEVDLIHEIGKIKGFEVEFSPAIFPDVFQQLQAKKIDFIGHVYNDEARKALYNLTEPHYIEKVKLLTLADKGIENPFTSGLRFATLAFSPMEESFKKDILVDYPTLKMASAETTFLGFKELFFNNADILLTTQTNIIRLTTVGKRAQYQYQIFTLPEKYMQEISLSFLTRKDDPKLMQEINDGLEILKANGTYDQLRKKYNL